MKKRFFVVAMVAIALGIFGFTNRNDSNTQRQNAQKAPASIYEPIVVLELFTSQGCSSCPAADMLLDEVKALYPEQVYTLSYHVDYWNYIGWDDPFSSSKHAERQSRYNQKLKYSGNYTPEVVVNGKAHFTGSNRSKMNAALLRFKKERVANTVSISKSAMENGTVTFHYRLEGNLEHKKVRAILVLDERTTAVKRGENRNRTIKNANIVVAENSISLNDTKGIGEIKVPDMVKADDQLHLVLLVEDGRYDITAATKKTL